MFATPLPVARAMFAVMAVLFALSLVERNPLLVFYAWLGLAVAGYLVGSARSATKRPR